MCKKFVALMLLLSLLLSMLPAVSAQEAQEPVSIDCCSSTLSKRADRGLHRPDFDGKLYEITPQRVEDTYRYLNEFYMQEHPEAALEVYYGTEEDRQVLVTLAQLITKDCKTHKEMADAVARWVAGNIVYDVYTSAYPSDTFYRRTGNCLSYAMLIRDLLRMLGVPAVVGDGWRGNMKDCTVSLFDMEGHAWCFVLLDGQWVLYDPLWLNEGTTDRAYMAEWIYFDTVEFVTPAYDEENLPPEAYDKAKIYYVNNRPVSYSNWLPTGFGTTSCFINNLAVYFVSSQDERDEGISDGWMYLDPSIDETVMERGQIYAGGWISYGDYYKGKAMSLAYTFANGMCVQGDVREFDGVEYYLRGTQSYRITASKENYRIIDGWFSVKPGYTGPFYWFPWGENVAEGCTLYIESENPEVATCDNQGIVTAYKEGDATFKIQLIRDEDNALLSLDYLNLAVSKEDRIADYSDHSATKPQEPIPTFTDVEKGSWYEASVDFMVSQGLMNGMGNGRFAPTESVTRAMLVTILYRAEGSPSVAGIANPFTDVPKSWYTDAVIWAASNGIVNGVGNGRFDPNGNVTREQIATILYRYEGVGDIAGSLSAFTDGSTVSAYAKKPMIWATAVGLINGVGNGRLAPTDTATRAQIATILTRYLQA